MPTNNLKENPNGESYRDRIAATGSPDLLGWAGSILAPRVQSVFDEFSAKYGWGDPGETQFSRRERGRAGRRAVSDGEVQASERAIRPLEGAPRVEGFKGPDRRLVTVAEKNSRDNNIPCQQHLWLPSKDIDGVLPGWDRAFATEVQRILGVKTKP